WAELAEALWRSERPADARHAYLRAFLAAPEEVDVDRVLDPDVVAAVRFAAHELELEAPEDPRAWAPVAGFLTGVFTLALLPPEQLGAHDGARFYRALADAEQARLARDPSLVERRRTLKAICPSAFAAYLEWLASAG